MRLSYSGNVFLNACLCAVLFLSGTVSAQGLVERETEPDCAESTPEELKRDFLRAADRGDLEMLRCCLKAGVDPDTADSDHVNPLMWAILEEHLEIANLLIDHGTNPNAVKDSGGSPFALALRFGRYGIAERLLQAGIDLQHRDQEGLTPLAWAAEVGQIDFVRSILNRLGDDINQTDLRNAFLCSRNYAQHEVANALSDRLDKIPPDDPSLISLDLSYVPKNLEDCFESLDVILTEDDRATLKKGLTTLEQEMSLGHFGLGLWLRNTWGLWAGSRLAQYFNELRINHPDTMSSIILDSYQRHLRGEPILLQKQVAESAAAEQKHCPPPNELISAIDAGDEATVALLATSGTDLEKLFCDTSTDWTALIRASHLGNTKIAGILLKAGAKVDSQDRGNTTAFMTAAAAGHHETMQLLLECGANPQHATNWGDTALIYAARGDHSSALEMLLALPGAGREGDELDRALIEAVEGGHLEATGILVSAGASPTWIGEYGWTALRTAADQGSVEVLLLLIQHIGLENLSKAQLGTLEKHAYGPRMRRYLRSLKSDMGEGGRVPTGTPSREDRS